MKKILLNESQLEVLTSLLGDVVDGKVGNLEMSDLILVDEIYNILNKAQR
jgi:hypothetical protein